MQSRDANRLRKLSDTKSCEHPSLEKEYNLSSDTGDYACTICGKSMPMERWEILREKQQKSNQK